MLSLSMLTLVEGVDTAEAGGCVRPGRGVGGLGRVRRLAAAWAPHRGRVRTAASGKVISASAIGSGQRRAVSPGDRADRGDLGTPFRGLTGRVARAADGDARIRGLGGCPDQCGGANVQARRGVGDSGWKTTTVDPRR